MGTQRDSSIDVMKGLLISLVVLNHITGIAGKCGISNSTFAVLHASRDLYVPFFMPAFFIVTGMCSNFNKPLRGFIWKNFKTLIIPGIIISLMVVFTEKGFDTKTLLNKIIHGGGYWFLCALFLSKIIYWSLKRYLTNHYVILFFLVLLIFASLFCRDNNLPNFWNYQQAFCLTIFIYVGDYRAKIFTSKPYLTASAYLILLMALLCMRMEIPVIVNKIYMSYISIPSFLILSITGSFLILVISKKIRSSYLLEFLGKESLIIYLIHMPILYKLIPAFQHQIQNVDNIRVSLGWYLIFFVISLSLSSLIALLIRTRYLRFIKGQF